MTDDAPKTATEIRMKEHQSFDLRRRHADAISNALFDEIRHLLPRDIEADVSRTLWEAVYRNGTMLINDREAERLGLERKDRQGWTASERVKMEQDRVAEMYAKANSVYHLKERSE